MDWVRGEMIGHGSFGKVSLAVPASQTSAAVPPAAMVVKSCLASSAASLLNERIVLEELQGCPEIIRCFGGGYSVEKGEKLYNVLLEFASQGSLADKVKNSDDRRLSEFEARRYAKGLVRGLTFVHKSGYVHCDIKLQNILLGDDGGVRIADFGLAKRDREGVRNSGFELRGTPMYMSPEMVAGGEQGTAADIWALGCAVAEMVTGAPVWKCSDAVGLLMRIGVGEEVPEIPGKLSEEGKDFLGKCFVKDPRTRWTAEMLLSHPFVADHDDDELSSPSNSPRCPFDFQDWVSEAELLESCLTILPSPEPEYSRSKSPAERLPGLVSDNLPIWSEDGDSWISVR
ncbi:PREDICTED: mitogen-activated protein kinase kinase kinase NPK1-like [Ipomoea nil]|uniref:mitogen-activated protein kinase kinase kinase NPK1-like n=1 Tax=Ipomoea nil TaxID=35883 RepID=UPI0009017E01|nr:PREDICTED: mitogen-activated protein kinase kinase kinase NPK1-like [Ipomoea nil]